MKTEEKILNYMDGTLSENESGELLHSLSVSPEKRIVLEQHIKLRELTSLAQKPYAVPQAIEASMAERFPAIASYNREIAGGAMAVREFARQNIFSRMASSVVALIAQYPVRTSLAVGGAAIIAFFMLSSGDAKYTALTSTSAHQTPGIQVLSQRSAESVSPSSATNIAIKSGQTTPSDVPNHSLTSGDSKRVAEHHNVVQTPVVLKNPSHLITPNLADISNDPVGANPAPDHEVPPSAVGERSQENIQTEMAAVTPVSSLREQNLSLASSELRGNLVHQNPYGRRDDASSSVPFAFRFYYGLGQSYVNVRASDKSITNRTESTPLLGIDYIASPYISVGLEAGSAAISQLLSQTVLLQNPELPSLSRVVVSNAVTNSSQWYGRLVGRFTINPYDLIHLEATLGAGAAFSSTTAPLVSAALSGGYDLSEKLGVSLGIAFAGAWTKPNAQNVATSTIASATDPIGYVTVNHAATTLFTPSVSVRFGLKFRPW